MKHFLFSSIFLFSVLNTYSQKKINGTSEIFKLNLKPSYENLGETTLDIKALLIDENNNGIIDDNELATIKLDIKNTGNVKAQGINVKFESIPKNNFIIKNPKEVYFINPGKTISYNLPISYNKQVLYEKEAQIKVLVEEFSGNNPEPYILELKPVYKRGVPPNIFVEMNFIDDNNNGLIESEENAELEMIFINKGQGVAQGLKILVEDNLNDDDFIIGVAKSINYLKPNDTIALKIPIKAGFNVKTAEHELTINVKEQFGYDMDPAILRLNTLEYQKAELVFAGHEILDFGEGTTAIYEDGQLQAGEMARMKVLIQNIGLGVAEDVNFELKSTDENIYVENGIGNFSKINSGEVKELIVKISPNKRVESDILLPIFLSVTENMSYGNIADYQLPLQLNQKPQQANIHEVKANLNEITKQIARFEYSSNKFTTNIGKIHDIASIETSKTLRNNAVAVVFGIEDYLNLPPAPYAKNDAEMFKNYLKERLGVKEVVVYSNNEASGFIFDNVFNPDNGELQKAIIKGETDLFVFYSGHGIPSKDGKNIYLFPADGKTERVQIQGYNINDLYTNLDKLGAKSTTIFIDACFSGSSRNSEKVKMENLIATKGISVVPDYSKPWKNNPNFSVFNSSGPNETSLGFDPSQTGLFTYFICAGLKGMADNNLDGKITNGELSNYVISKVKETSKKVFGLQTPQFHGNPNYILVEY